MSQSLVLTCYAKHLEKTSVMAYILLNTKPGTSLQVIDRIRVKTKEAVAAHAIFGRYDAIVVI
jgi:hypothetical protein